MLAQASYFYPKTVQNFDYNMILIYLYMIKQTSSVNDL
jgi:hypothetical protein